MDDVTNCNDLSCSICSDYEQEDFTNYVDDDRPLTNHSCDE